MVSQVPVLTRLWLCWVCWFRTLFDADFAARALELSRGASGVLEQALPEPLRSQEPSAAPEPSLPASQDSAAGALQLLSLLQRDGRLIDFLQQDITSFSDSDVGAAARVVHEGCRRALHSHASIESLRSEAEGAAITVDGGGSGELKLTGNLAGKPPYRGVLRHRGWRVARLKLPTLVGAHDASVVAPAEVEL